MALSRTDSAEQNGGNTDQIEDCAEGNISGAIVAAG
jgi:hypothetical protein